MQAWFIPSPHRLDSNNPLYKDKEFKTKKIEFPSVIYEVEIIGQSGIEDRLYLKFKKVFWSVPLTLYGFERSAESSVGGKLHIPKRDIFYTKEEVIEEHKSRLLDFIDESGKIFQQQVDGLENYENYLQDVKYISPFTGEEK